MKYTGFICLTLLLSALGSCKSPCEPENPVCYETPPENELCQAAFNRWFFDAESNSCEQIGYSGCSARGFATKEDCEACKCN